MRSFLSLFVVIFLIGVVLPDSPASAAEVAAPRVRLIEGQVVLVSGISFKKCPSKSEVRIFRVESNGSQQLMQKKVLAAGLRKIALQLPPGTYRLSWRIPNRRPDVRSKRSLPFNIQAQAISTPSPVASPTLSPTQTPTPVSTPSAIPIVQKLLPGGGFDGATSDVQSVGTPDAPGYDAEVIARWAAVPYQVVTTTLRFGVVAFHRNGIEKVLFSANGGAWVESVERSINPSTGISEFWVTLDAQDFSDQKVEIRAIAFPKIAGKPRILQGVYQATPGSSPAEDGVYSYYAWTNAGGSYSRPNMYVSGNGSDSSGDGSSTSPFRTLGRAAQSIQETFGSVDGATILCYAGEYEFSLKWGFTSATAADRPLLIKHAPGVTREQVLISAGRPRVAKMHLQNVTLKTDASGNFYLGYNDLVPDIWLEGVKVSALNGRYAPNSASVLMKANAFVTETEWSDTPDGPVSAILVRNTNISKIRSDLVSGSQVILNVTGADIDPADTGAHPDVWQIYRPNGSLNNHVIDGLRAVDGILAQGIFIAALADGEKIRNVALSNIVIRKEPSVFTSQINRPCEHLILTNVTLDQTLYIRAGEFTNTSFQGNLLSAVTLDLQKTTPQAVAAIDWQHNHFVDAISYGTYTFGTDVTTGAAPVESWASGDFRPLSGGLLTKRVPLLHSNVDQSMMPRNQLLTAVGALEELP
ncbi:MAG: hypothetical protein J0M12_05070 [Deltaproteobacteria bacterium]|nr:hypothetical protein [Deltaproteobacteria bacterium]